MRPNLLCIALSFCAVLAAAAPPPHLKQLPASVLRTGPAPQGLEKLSVGEVGRLWLPGGEREFKVESMQGPAGHAATRFGAVRGVGHAAVTLGPEGGFARVTEGTTVWLLEFRDGATYAVRAGEGGLAIADFDAGARGEPRNAAQVADAAAAGMSSAAVPPAPVKVGHLALVDTDFQARYPGGLTQTRIDHLVALANQAFVDSRIGVVIANYGFVVVNTALLDPSGLDNVDDMRAALVGGGAFAGVNLAQQRTAHAADLVTLFRVHDMYAREVCGVAYFPASALDGVNVVMDGTHGGSVCDPYVFAHEVGHNLGARHQYPADASVNSAHGFVRLGQFTTIMGSLGTGSEDRLRLVGYFSNPDIACGNMPCGDTTTSNNAGAMNANRTLVASYVQFMFNDSLGTPPAPVNADSDGDSASDRVDAFPFDALETLDADGDGVPASRDAFPANGSEWLDSDGGGQGNNVDADDDNDGSPDGGDAFPLLQSESADADDDGTGDVADPFDGDPYEQRDTDLDGTGDRADTDDDQDGTVDVATLTAAADGELLVADGATDRVLRFQGSDMSPLGTLVQLAPAEVTIRSEMSSAASGELYFVAGSELRRLDRLRSPTSETFLRTFFHASFTTGFPLSPRVVPSGDVVIAEWGQGATAAMRPGRHPDALPQLQAAYWESGLTFGGPAPHYHLALEPGGDVIALDGTSGTAREITYDLSGGFGVVPNDNLGLYATPYTSGSIAVSALRRLFWADRVDGSVRNALLPGGSGAAVPTLTGADARAIAIGPDGVLYVAMRSGGVHRYDATTGADLGLAIAASETAEPLALAWVPKILDTSMPALPTPPAPTLLADPSPTPATGGPAPLAPPCITDCATYNTSGGGGGGGGGGGAPDPLLLALLAALAARRAATSSSARTAATSSSPPRS